MSEILCVDDESEMLDICKIFLEREGFTVKTVDSAMKALELLKTIQFDAIVSDYQMPEMDGIEFLKIVRQNHQSIPFIIFTGKGREEIVIQSFEYGASHYVQKGGDPKSQFADLAHKIHNAIDKWHLEQKFNETELRYRKLLESDKDLKRTATIIFKKYGIVFDLFPIGITISDESGTIIESNKAAIDLLGLSKEEEGKRSIYSSELKIVRPDGSPMPPEEFPSVRALKENKIISNVIMGIVKREGKISWINVTATPMNIRGYGVVIIYPEY